MPKKNYLGPASHNLTDGVAAGQWYTARVLGSSYDFWVSRPLNRHEARAAAHEFVGEDIYNLDEIDSVCKRR